MIVTQHNNCVSHAQHISPLIENGKVSVFLATTVSLYHLGRRLLSWLYLHPRRFPTVRPTGGSDLSVFSVQHLRLCIAIFAFLFAYHMKR